MGRVMRVGWMLALSCASLACEDDEDVAGVVGDAATPADATSGSDASTSGACEVGGCSGQLCGEAGEELASDCAWTDAYACYAEASCERQSDGRCGWTETAELTACLESPPSSEALAWYRTCGDPVCRVDAPADDSVEPCTDEAAGGSCSSAGATCDPGDGCGVRLVCSDTDPTQGPGGCPVSRAAAKRDIRYVDADRRAELHGDLLALPLAEYSYRRDPAAARQLGFIIEDVEPGVLTRGDHVQLYNYMSLAVAALQEQAGQIRELREQVRVLSDRLGESAPATLPQCSPDSSALLSQM